MSALGPVLFYGRRSPETKREGKGGVRFDDTVSTANQEAAARARAERDWPGAPFEAYIDDRLSGGVAPQDRPAMARLLERLGELARRGTVPSALVLTSQARAARGGVTDVDVVYDAAYLAGLERVSLIDDRDVDLDPLERFEPHMRALIDKQYRDNARKSAKRGRATLAEQGRPSGHVVYGYASELDDGGRPSWVVVDDEAKVVELIWQLAEEGMSATRIAEQLGADGIGRRGKAWHLSQVSRVLRQPAYAGLLEHKGKLLEARWHGIIELERWQRMQHDLRPLRPTGTRGPTHWLLGERGVLRCAVCQGAMHAALQHRAGPQAVCGGRHVSVDLELVAELVAELIAQRVAGAGAGLLELLAARTTDTVPLREERARIELRLKELGRSFAAGRLTIDVLEAATADLTLELEGLDRQLAQAVRLPAELDLEELVDVEAFMAWPKPVRRQVAGLLLEAVDVAPAGRGYLSGARKLGPVGSDEYVAEVERLTLARLDRHWR